MRFKSSMKSVLSSIVLQVVTMAIGLVMPRLYITTFGSEINGLVTSITQFVAYFSLAEAGLAGATISSLYSPLADNNHIMISRILSSAKKFYFNIGFIFSGLTIALAVIYPLFVSARGVNSFEIGILVGVLGFAGAFEYFTLSRYRALLTADQRYYVIANASTVANCISFALVFVSIKLSFGIIAVRTIALTSFILRSLILNVYVRRNYKKIDYRAAPADSALSKRWAAMTLQLLGLTQASLPVILLTFISGNLGIVSVYSVYNMVAVSVLSVLFAITNGFVSPFGDMIAKRETDNLKTAYRNYEFVFLIVMIWAYSCMNILYLPFIKLYTRGISDTNYIQPLLAFFFVLSGITYNLKTPAGTLIGSAGLFKETRTATIIQTVIVVLFSLLFVPFWGIYGILAALIVSSLYRDVELVLFMSQKVTALPSFESFKRMLNCLFIFIISNIPFYFIHITAGNILSLLFAGAVVGLWCFFVAVAYSWFFDKEVLSSVIEKVRSGFAFLGGK